MNEIEKLQNELFKYTSQNPIDIKAVKRIQKEIEEVRVKYAKLLNDNAITTEEYNAMIEAEDELNRLGLD